MPEFRTDAITDRFEAMEDYSVMEPLTFDDVSYLIALAVSARYARIAQKNLQKNMETCNADELKKRKEYVQQCTKAVAELDKMLEMKDGE